MFAMSMKYSEGFSTSSNRGDGRARFDRIGFLALAIRTLAVAVAYTIWTAAGTLVAVGWDFSS